MTKKVTISVVSAILVLVVLGSVLLGLRADDGYCDRLYPMQMASIWPNLEEAPADSWPRTLTDTENGLRVTYTSTAPAEGNTHCTRNTVSADGAHLKLTFHTGTDGAGDDSKTFKVIIGTNASGNPNNNAVNGLSFKVQLQTGQLYCYVDGTPIDHSGYEGYKGNIAPDRIWIPGFDTSTNVADIKTEITDNGDFVFNLNGHDFVVAKSVWSTSANFGDGSAVYFKIAPQGRALDYTWNCFHGGSQPCYTQTSGEDAKKLNTDKMAMANIWPNTTEAPNETGWPRTITETEDGLRIKYSRVDNNLNHCTRTMTAIDGAHMKLTFNVPKDANDKENTCDASKTIGLTFGKTGSGSFNNNGAQGIHFKLQVQTGQLYCYVDGKNIDHSEYEGYNGSIAPDRIFIPESKFDRSATTLDIKTSITDDGDFVLNVNGYAFKVAKSVWEASAYDGEDVFVKVGQEGRILDCTWHYLHGGSEICKDEMTEIIGAENTEKVVTAIETIDAVELPITWDSEEKIKAAKTAVEAVPEYVRNFIHNMEYYELVLGMFEKLAEPTINLDSDVYPVELRDVGPDNRWPGKADFFKAENGKGVTIKMMESITVQQFGLNLNKAASLDNLHMQFANFDCTGAGNKFALVLSHAGRCDVTSNNRCMWFVFNVYDDHVVVDLYAEGMAARTLLDTSLIGKASLVNPWSIRVKKLESGDYDFSLLDIANGTIPKEYVEAAQGVGLNPDSLYITYSAYNLGNQQPTTSTIDFVSIHSGADECYSNVTEEEYEATEECKKLIDAIGTVTEKSGKAIQAANDSYNALSARMRNLVTNADVLVRATRDYNNIASDVKAASKVIAAIKKLPSDPKKATYKQLIDCYGKYLDLYPRCRKRVTNVDKLMKCVKAYEKAHPGIELKLETVNEYTGGKDAHYIK